ncbi:MAG: hypothetical protein ACREM6_08260 [Vulcanimicrobiaceae bacterium]
MNRLISVLTAAVFAASLSTAAFAATSNSMGSHAMGKTATKCTTGETWVKGYTNKAGKKVKGYCRKDAMHSMTHKATKPAK